MEQDINLSTLISLSGDEYAYYPLHSRNQPDGCEVVQIYKYCKQIEQTCILFVTLV